MPRPQNCVKPASPSQYPGSIPNWPYAINSQVAGLKRSPIRDMLALTRQPGIISFAGGLPAPELFPLEQVKECTAHVLATDGRSALQYGPPHSILLEEIVAFMAKRGVQTRLEEIFLTTGAQQGLTILARLLCPGNSPIIVEDILYTGARQALEAHQPIWHTVPSRPDTGMDTAAVESHLEETCACLIYTVPVAQNPTGINMGPEQRKQLVALGTKYKVPIIEDDPYGALQYTDEILPPLKSLDQTGGVLYCGSFSKILSPAMRLGWIIAPPELHTTLAVLKETIDLETSAFIQRIAAEFCRRGYLWPHIEQLRQAYGQRLQTMLAALEREFPPEIDWTHPTGGMFVWVMLPEHGNTAAMLPAAIEQKVAYIPGFAFAVNGNADHALRLNFSNSTPEKIEEGITRLARVVAHHLETA